MVGSCGVSPFGRISAVVAGVIRSQKLFVGSAFFLAVAGLAQAVSGIGKAWRTNGPTGPISAIAVHPQEPRRLYAGVGDPGSSLSSEAFESKTAASHWKSLGMAPSGYTITALAVDPETPSTLLAAATRLGLSQGSILYRSIDGGITWTLLQAFDGLAIRTVAVDPGNSQVLYVGGYFGSGQPLNSICGTRYLPPLYCTPTTTAALFRSVDGGVSWLRLPFSMWPVTSYYAPLDEVVVDPRDSFTIYLRVDSFLWKSVDRGDNWHLLRQTGCNVNSISLDPKDPNQLFVAFGSRPSLGSFCSGGFQRSKDGGETFETILPGALPGGTGVIDAQSVTIDPRDSSVLYAAYLVGPPGTSSGTTDQIVSVSRDGGRTWSSLNWSSQSRVRRLVVDASGTFVYAATSSGVFEYQMGRNPITFPFRP